MASSKTELFMFLQIFIKNEVIFVPTRPDNEVRRNSSEGALAHLCLLLKLIVKWDVPKYFIYSYSDIPEHNCDS